MAGGFVFPDGGFNRNPGGLLKGLPEQLRLNEEIKRRDRIDRREELRQVDITDQVDLITTPGQSQDITQKALIDLARLDPKIAMVTKELLRSGGEEAQQFMAGQNDRIFREMVILEKIPEQKDKIAMLGTLAKEAIAGGRSGREYFDMAKMSKDQLDLEIMKNKTKSGLLTNILPKARQETFSPVLGPNGEILGQRSSLTQKIVADPRTPKAGAGNTVIDPENLTPDGFLLEQLPDGSVRKTKVLSPEQVSQLSKAGNTATGETRIMDDGTVIFANKDSTVSVVDQAGRNIPEGPERTKVLKAALKAKGDLARIQSGQKAAGTQAIKASGKAFEKVAVIRANILNLDRAVEAIDEGAKTGAIISRFPSIRTASIKLDQVQRELGLDKVASVTFGALSKGELDLALATAIPTTLNPEELKKWLIGKKQAQIKLMGYIERSALFLGEPGNTLKDWKEKQIADQALLNAKNNQGQAVTPNGNTGPTGATQGVQAIPPPPPGFEVQP